VISPFKKITIKKVKNLLVKTPTPFWEISPYGGYFPEWGDMEKA
jgi:hypothetical protein